MLDTSSIKNDQERAIAVRDWSSKIEARVHILRQQFQIEEFMENEGGNTPYKEERRRAISAIVNHKRKTDMSSLSVLVAIVLIVMYSSAWWIIILCWIVFLGMCYVIMYVIMSEYGAAEEKINLAIITNYTKESPTGKEGEAVDTPEVTDTGKAMMSSNKIQVKEGDKVLTKLSYEEDVDKTDSYGCTPVGQTR